MVKKVELMKDRTRVRAISVQILSETTITLFKTIPINSTNATTHLGCLGSYAYPPVCNIFLIGRDPGIVTVSQWLSPRERSSSIKRFLLTSSATTPYSACVSTNPQCNCWPRVNWMKDCSLRNSRMMILWMVQVCCGGFGFECIRREWGHIKQQYKMQQWFSPQWVNYTV